MGVLIMHTSFEVDLQESTELAPKTEKKLDVPKRYKVVLLNDDYTPMEFVVDVIKRFFHLKEEAATAIMLMVHFQGRGVCGIYTRDIAETKMALVNEYARAHEHPLLSVIEPE